MEKSCTINYPLQTLKERWDAWEAPNELEGCVKLFWELIDSEEESDSGTRFKPNKLEISSCRVWDTHRLSKIILKMKALAHVPT